MFAERKERLEIFFAVHQLRTGEIAVDIHAFIPLTDFSRQRVVEHFSGDERVHLQCGLIVAAVAEIQIVRLQRNSRPPLPALRRTLSPRTTMRLKFSSSY